MFLPPPLPPPIRLFTAFLAIQAYRKEREKKKSNFTQFSRRVVSGEISAFRSTLLFILVVFAGVTRCMGARGKGADDPVIVWLINGCHCYGWQVTVTVWLVKDCHCYG